MKNEKKKKRHDHTIDQKGGSTECRITRVEENDNEVIWEEFRLIKLIKSMKSNGMLISIQIGDENGRKTGCFSFF